MTDYMTEQEQIEQLKGWIKEYGLTILAGVILAIVLVTGWRAWDAHATKVLLKASLIYDQMLNDRAQNDKEGQANATEQAKILTTKYAKSPYAQMAALMLARDAALNKNYPAAIGYLDWTIDHTNNAPLKQIAKIRIARIYNAQSQPDKAIDTLQGVNDKAFQGLKEVVLGDAYVEQNQLDDAKKSYQLALDVLPQEDVSERPIIEMKLDNLNNKA